MKELYSLNPKIRWRLIIILSTFMGVIVLSGLIENHNLQRIHRDFSSMYTDRLIPAAEIYFISEHLYQKRLLLEGFDSGPIPKSTVLGRIDEGNETVDSLITAFENTYLVHQESIFLDNLKRDLDRYFSSEKKIIQLISEDLPEEAMGIFETETRDLFGKVILDLQLLAKIQPSVGKQLIQSSNADFASNNILLYLRIALTLIIGLFILILIRTSGLLHQPHQKFRMN